MAVDPDNTRTPLIVWGKGVRGPLPDSTPSSHDEYSEPFGLTHLLRRDVEQADVAALMSALIGTNWPINSVGVLPDVDPTKPGYLLAQEGEKTQAEVGLVNAKVILEHYRVKHGRKPLTYSSCLALTSLAVEKKTHSLFYRPYSYFKRVEDAEVLPGESTVVVIEDLIRHGNLHEARLLAKEFIAQTLEGLRYLQTSVLFSLHISRLAEWAV